MRVGLFFGSFDPPHIGHVNVVMGAINSSQVGRVLVIPAYQNLWKESSSKFSYRYAMSCMQFDTLPFVPPQDLPENVHVVYVPQITICSTCIRNRVKLGIYIQPFVRDTVEAFIDQYRLYV